VNIIDLHADTISTLYHHDDISLKDADRMINIDKLRKSNYLLQCFACFINYKNINEKHQSALNYCDELIDRYYLEMEKCKEYINPVLKYSDIENNIKNNIISSLLTIEEGGVCLGDINNLLHFYQRGVRLITLTWNYPNELAYPNCDYTGINYKDRKLIRFLPDNKRGLTEKGREFVLKMNELGMIIDLSHASDKTFFDVVALSTKPIMLSHSCSRSICNHARNASDEMLYKLKENKGVIGINFYHNFIKEDSSLATLEDIYLHIDYIKNLIGIDYIALGSDFDGINNNDIELKDASLMSELLSFLKDKGYSQEEINKISYLNALRVIKENLS